jgi:hypothetical protein
MRRTPMRRSAIKPAHTFSIHESRMPPLTARPADAPRAVMVAAAALEARPKRSYVRSEALMRAYRLLPCQHCGRDDGTVCGAHPNTGADGKGMGIKASDERAASLCAVCHHAIDQGSVLDYEERLALHEAARRKTLAELVRRALWPPGVPVPT